MGAGKKYASGPQTSVIVLVRLGIADDAGALGVGEGERKQPGLTRRAA